MEEHGSDGEEHGSDVASPPAKLADREMMRLAAEKRFAQAAIAESKLKAAPADLPGPSNGPGLRFRIG